MTTTAYYRTLARDYEARCERGETAQAFSRRYFQMQAQSGRSSLRAMCL
jgi:hypothetical protein